MSDPTDPPPPNDSPPSNDPATPMPYAERSTPPLGTGYPGPYAGPAPTQDERNVGLLTHILGIVTGFLGPLIVWLLKKDESAYIDDQAKDALNFKITMLFVYLAAGVLTCVTFGLGAFLIFPLIIIEIIFGILGAVASSRGEAYRYPMTLRLVK